MTYCRVMVTIQMCVYVVGRDRNSQECDSSCNSKTNWRGEPLEEAHLHTVDTVQVNLRVICTDCRMNELLETVN